MPTPRDQLLARLTALCRQLYDRRRALTETLALVSDKAKADVVLLVLRLDGLRRLEPFPQPTADQLAPLDDLKTRLDDTAGDPLVVQDELLRWVEGFAPADPGASAASPAIPPINQRMIDALFAFRTAVDRARRRLLRDRDRYDPAAYRAARNAFTLARAAYDERLRLDQVTPTNADCATLENELTPALATVNGAGFPAAIRAGADFVSERLFPTA